MRRIVSKISVLFCSAAALLAAAAAHEESKDPAPSWSLAPLRKPSLPEVQLSDWPSTEVDRFILARMEQQHLKPSPPADKRTLLRRVYFDLLGLPPSPEALERFLADTSPAGYERVVNELLASPRYGERWARHWLDVIHFAETHGHDQDRIRTNAWPYRDYVISAFNSDKPYSRFIEEQVAADVLFPDQPSLIPALGFLAAGPWDESSLRDIREDSIDRQAARYLDRDDIVTTTMSAFTSTTVHCARCHNHKFDPILQRDYYALQAVFAATDRADRTYDSLPTVGARRRELRRDKQRLADKDPALLAELLTEEKQREARQWLTKAQPGWTTITAKKIESKEGSTLQVQSDGSITSTGHRPEKDTYIVDAAAPSRAIRAIRLEVLADDALPQKGPGRQDNGNLHLTEFAITLLDGSIANTNAESVAITNALADFNQDGWTIQHAIDGKPKTAWGIHPNVGMSHQAVFAFSEPLPATRRFRVRLDQHHGGGHLIGRFRLSTTTDPAADRLLPIQLADLASKPADQWSKSEKLEVATHWLAQKLEGELAALPKPQVVYAGASDFAPDGSHKPTSEPRPIHILKRGEVTKPGAVAVPGSLRCVTNLLSHFELTSPNDEGARRAALARWISHPQNPLTWRSIVNRVWHYHFGRGIVETPNDFGAMGAKPSHPELLDWLAVHFRDDGGSLKRLHRLIVLSATYRQSSQNNPAGLVSDSDNRLLWRMNRSRLDAESIRDAVLQISGSLNLEMGGPSFKNFALSPGVHVTPVVDYTRADLDSPALNRRSIYRFLFRTIPDPMMDTLDCPDGSQFTASRTSSFTALQALTMLNDPFMVRQCERFAARLNRERSDLAGQVDLACDLALSRKPLSKERQEFLEYAGRHGLANFCRMLLNSNEFAFVN